MTNLPTADRRDPWGVTTGDDAGQTRNATDELRIARLHGIQPLDAQIGRHPKATVPPQLRDAIFGQPAPDAADLNRVGGDPGRVPPLASFAVLEAAKITNLPQMLANSGLEYRCLFKGDALDKLGDAAPWIVRLEDDNRFTRNLFTEGPAPWQIWTGGAGMVLRARASLDQMWRHLRRFTRVQDETGDWFYFRFWEPRYAAVYFATLADHPDRLRVWFEGDFGSLESICIGEGEDFTVFQRAAPSATPGRPNRPFRYEQPERDAHIRAKRRDFTCRLRDHLCGASGRFDALPPRRQAELAWHFTGAAAQSGLRIERAVADFAEASVIFWRPLDTDAEFTRILTAEMHQIDKGKQLLHAAKQRRLR